MKKSWTRDEVLELARSYQVPAVLAAAVELDVFNLLGNDRLDAAAVSAAAGADPRAMRVLLDALVALKLLEQEAEGAAYLVPADIRETLTDDGSNSVLSMARHQANSLRGWAQLGRVVKSGEPAEKSPGLRGEEADHRAFIMAMHDVAGPIADRVLSDLALPPFARLLDVGGGSGSWTVAWLKRYPRAEAVLFDLAPVIPLAEERFRREGVGARVTCVAGDYHADRLPAEVDVVWLSSIVHQHSREESRALFSRIAEALRPGGSLLIRDVVMKPSRVEPEAGALFAVNMLVATRHGGTYTFEELEQDLGTAGLYDVKMLREDPGMNSVVSALKPHPHKAC